MDRKILVMLVVMAISILTIGCNKITVGTSHGKEETVSTSNKFTEPPAGDEKETSVTKESTKVENQATTTKEAENTTKKPKESTDDGSVPTSTTDKATMTVASLEELRELLTVVDYNFEGEAVEVSNPTDIYVLANKKNALPADYIPEDLMVPNISFSFDGPSDKQKMRKIAGEALEVLMNTAKEEGINFYAVSGYRAYATQKRIFNNFASSHGEEEANKFSARPGQSEHQTGLAMDISAKSVGCGLKTALGQKPEGIWLRENAHRFGFIIRYPEGKTDITGYQYEPWHIRYVGKEIAGYIYKNDLTYEEFYMALQ